MKWLLLGSTALVALAADNAPAADLPPRMPVKAPVVKAPLVPPFSWAGFYLGAVAGYAWRDPEIVINDPIFPPGVVPRSITVDPKGFLGGIQGGYNFQSGNVVFGFEADISYANIRDGGTAGPGAPFEIFFAGKPPVLERYFFTSSGD